MKLTGRGYAEKVLLNGVDKIPISEELRRSVKRAHTWHHGNEPHHITAHPSASWKLSAISVPFCSVQTIKVSDRVIQVSQTMFLSGDTVRRKWWDRNLAVFDSHRPW